MALFAAGPTGSQFMEDQMQGGARLVIQTPPSLDSQWLFPQPGFNEIEGLAWSDPPEIVYIRNAQQGHPTQVYGALILRTPLFDFFNEIVVRPLRIDAGFILSDLSFPVEIYNSFFEERTFVSFTNDAGPGVTVSGLPALPSQIEAQTSLFLTVDIAAEGPPINGELVFVFDTTTVVIPITGTRSTVFAFEPQTPIREKLLFLTDVIERQDKSEQRISLREAPRQVIEMAYELDGRSRQLMESIIFSNQSLEFGVPIFFEASRLTTPIVPTDTIIDVDNTNFRDYRVGGEAIVFNGPFDNEVGRIAALTPTTIEFQSAFQKPFDEGLRVMPIRVAQMLRLARGRKRVVNLQREEITFSVIDSTRDLSDTSAFDSFEGKVLLDEPNLVRPDGMREQFSRDILRLDSGTGTFTFFSDQDVSRRSHAKGFFSSDMERLWNVRGLLHALRGRQQSLFIPSFYDDFTPVAAISSAAVTLDFVNMGYTLFVQDRAPRDTLQVLLKDGTKVNRRIISSTELSEDVEQITVDGSWGIDATVDEIKRISYLEAVRIDSDEISIQHRARRGDATIVAPLISVLS